MGTKTVQVYRLWPNGHWDVTEVEIPDEPSKAEIVEERAVAKAWGHFANLQYRPVRIGLWCGQCSPEKA